MPANLKLNSESQLEWNPLHDGQFNDLNDAEFLVAEALSIRQTLHFSEVQDLLETTAIYGVVKKLVDKGICWVWENLQDRYRPKWESKVYLSPAYAQEAALEKLLNEWNKAPKQLALLLSFLQGQQQGQSITSSQLLQKAQASPAQLKALTDKNILIVRKEAVDRLQLDNHQALQLPNLSLQQQSALEEIQTAHLDKSVCLLFGITGSGKTEIYLHLLANCLHKNQQALYLLPEIALTGQMIRRLESALGGRVAVYHSKFNPNERVELWQRVALGEIKIVLGARSAVFLPFSQLGLVICDEEHDGSYKQQDPAPRYHCRDAAIYLAQLYGAKVLLGSATPSIESFAHAKEGKYGLVQLKERFGHATLPDIFLADNKGMKQKKEPLDRLLTPSLHQAIAETLQRQEQIILFQNRRGFAPYLLCDTCGWIPQCAQCDVSLTFHKFKHQLACHYCGSHYPINLVCAACGNHHFSQKNFGTEQVEETIRHHFPQARVARMDHDTVKGKHDHEKIIQQFEAREMDILVGTQMVVKGLDFPHLRLVGILDADGLLGFADFRVNERAFQLMEQVSGRAGRKGETGQVWIQVSNLQHPVLPWVKDHDYEAMFQSEINSRQAFDYPPFTRLIQITCKHKDPAVAEAAAQALRAQLEAHLGNMIQGP
ncbi:MAG: primosomal protein N', partial [Sphingobacteriia bacterium]